MAEKQVKFVQKRHRNNHKAKTNASQKNASGIFWNSYLLDALNKNKEELDTERSMTVDGSDILPISPPPPPQIEGKK